MSSPVIKKTLNLHKYSVRVNDFILNWKILLPSAFALAGLMLGCLGGKGEWKLIRKITDMFSAVLSEASPPVLTEFIRALLIPTALAAVLFFLGLSAYGGFAVNFVPLAYSVIIGAVSFYMYSTYTLKGLGYCVIMIFPYAVLSLTGLVLISAESISMSEFMLKSISGSRKFIDYGFKSYCTNCLKKYVFIIISAAIKAVLTHLFIGLFSF